MIPQLRFRLRHQAFRPALTGGGFGLTFASRNTNDTRTELGARADDLTRLGAMPLPLRARVAWAHDDVSNAALGAVFQALPGAAFIVNGAAVPKNSALLSAGGQLFFTSNWSIEAKFDGEFASTAQTYALTSRFSGRGDLCPVFGVKRDIARMCEHVRS
ncbi:MAG: autotransporter domain-containing protein [Xanthobacteraceae bacterium]